MKIFDAQATCNKIFDLSRERGWSDSKLARILDVTPQAISKWRRGMGAPSIDRIVMMSEIFKTSFEDIIACQDIDMGYCFLDAR